VWGNIDKKLTMDNTLIPSEKIGIIGAPRYDDLFGLKSNKGEYILLASSADPQPEEVEGLRVQKIEKYLLDILEICKTVSGIKEKLVVKLHPSPTQLTNLDELTNIIDPEIRILSSGDITELLPNAKVLICIGISSTMIEAIILGKPVIFIPGIDYNWKNPSIVELNGCLTSNIKNIKDDLLKILQNEKFCSDIQNLSNNYLRELIEFQGHSSKTFYEFLKK
jgi:UDP-N-acetylglucosamine 2-epimerase